MRAEIHVPNDDQLTLRPGMTGKATIILNEPKKRWTVPSTALVRVGKQLNVYVLDELSKQDPPRGKVKAVPVTVGRDDGKIVEIIPSTKFHLTGKELVIAKGNGVVREGETAIPVPARELIHE
jgi:multidrug efflux pump subunit AcrA (membrane-fusion protein)